VSEATTNELLVRAYRMIDEYCDDAGWCLVCNKGDPCKSSCSKQELLKDLSDALPPEMRERLES
jgi:hypothetical protein